MHIKELNKKTGAGLMLCKLALDYANGDEKIAIAYIKAKTFAISTPKLTFDERVKMFISRERN